MAKNKSSTSPHISPRSGRIAIWFPIDSGIEATLSTYTAILQSEMPVKDVKVHPYAAILHSLEESIRRREIKK